MPTRTAIEQRLAEAQSRLNPRRRRIIQAALDNPDETFFLSSRALARRYRVDPATIVRTIQALATGATPTSSRTCATTSSSGSRPTGSWRRRPARSAASPTTCGTAWSGTSQSRRGAFGPGPHAGRGPRAPHPPGALRSWSSAWTSRPRWPGSSPTASWRSASMRRRRSAAPGTCSTRSGRLDEPRPARRDQLRALPPGHGRGGDARRRRAGVPTFGITDSDTTPIARNCDAYLLAPISASTFTGSYAAPMAVLNAVLVACAQLKPKRSLALLRQTEKEYLSGSALVRPGARGRGRPAENAERGSGDMKPRDWLSRFEGRRRAARGGSRSPRRPGEPVGRCRVRLLAGALDP